MLVIITYYEDFFLEESFEDEKEKKGFEEGGGETFWGRGWKITRDAITTHLGLRHLGWALSAHLRLKQNK